MSCDSSHDILQGILVPEIEIKWDLEDSVAAFRPSAGTAFSPLPWEPRSLKFNTTHLAVTLHQHYRSSLDRSQPLKVWGRPQSVTTMEG